MLFKAHGWDDDIHSRARLAIASLLCIFLYFFIKLLSVLMLINCLFFFFHLAFFVLNTKSHIQRCIVFYMWKKSDYVKLQFSRSSALCGGLWPLSMLTYVAWKKVKVGTWPKWREAVVLAKPKHHAPQIKANNYI